MAIGDTRPQEVQAIEVVDTHVTADLQLPIEIRATVPGSSSAA